MNSQNKKIKKKDINKPKKRKKTIPVKLKQQLWLNHFGKVFESKCFIDWCDNIINVFDFEAGHDIPESKGGKIDLHNLYPICSKCNKSMGNRFTILSSIDNLNDMDGIWNDFNVSNEICMEILN
uniref:HNH endonuclease 5 domain-containing protein n=1 Tax=viral metagenome TaxID=1070528 RepID=A0A6C0CZ16_9ZZZZ